MSWTNCINAQQQGTQYQNSSGVWSGLDGSTAGFVLTSNGTGVAPSFQSAATSSISITGDSGTITGGSLTIFANNATENCGSSVLFTNLGTTSTLNVTDSNNNTIIGQLAGVLVNTASDCTGIGQGCLAAITDDVSLVAVGTGSLAAANDSESNVAVGAFSLATVVGGGGNTAVGDRSGYQLQGDFNTLYGYFSGQNYTGSESSNVLIQNSGVLGENNVLRIGTQGSSNLQVNTCFIAGIAGVSVSNLNYVTIDTTSGQLGSTAISPSSISITGDSGTITGTSFTIYAHNSTQNCGSSVKFVNSGSTSTLNVTDASGNTIIGNLAGNSSMSGAQSVALGTSALALATTGTVNTAIGWSAMAGGIVTGQLNTAIGSEVLYSCTSGTSNVGCGSAVFLPLTTGVGNTGVGYFAGSQLVSGGYNCLFGDSAGFNYTSSESSNICIANDGTIGESHTIRIGTQGTGDEEQDTCFIAGITGVTVSSANFVTIDTLTGQLGSASSGPASVSITGDSGTITGTSFTIYANNALQGCGSSVSFVNSGSTSLLHLSDNNGNVAIGALSIINGGGTNNTCLGVSSVSNGTSNVCIGADAGTGTSGNNSVYVGFEAGDGAAPSGNSTFVGYDAGASGAGSSVAIGYESGVSAGADSVTVGVSANNFGGTNSCAIGNSSLCGNYGVSIGFNAGSSGSGNDNIYISNVGASESNTIRIGTQGSGAGQQNLCFIAGITGVTISSSAAVLIDTATGQLGTVISSRRYKENIESMGEDSEGVLSLRPVTFNYKSDKTKTLQFGLIAEEVEAVFPELVLYDSQGQPDSVKYHELPILLLNELIILRREIEILRGQL